MASEEAKNVFPLARCQQARKTSDTVGVTRSHEVTKTQIVKSRDVSYLWQTEVSCLFSCEGLSAELHHKAKAHSTIPAWWTSEISLLSGFGDFSTTHLCYRFILGVHNFYWQRHTNK